MNESSYEVKAIGQVESPLADPASVPKQGDEGAPDAWLVFESAVLDALEGIQPGDEVIVLTWLHRARRDVLRVHPRGDPSRPQQGVFSTRSPHRPNPIGLHPVEIVSIDGPKVRVRNLEAVNGTPIVDLEACAQQRCRSTLSSIAHRSSLTEGLETTVYWCYGQPKLI
jgi:tRNA-Thr(GGU) m(6)t(6)A37 methyltransferase TsaA